MSEATLEKPEVPAQTAKEKRDSERKAEQATILAENIQKAADKADPFKQEAPSEADTKRAQAAFAKRTKNRLVVTLYGYLSPDGDTFGTFTDEEERQAWLMRADEAGLLADGVTYTLTTINPPLTFDAA